MDKEFHALTGREREILLNNGFLLKEVKAFDSAKTPTGETQEVAFNSAPFQKMISNRVEWVRNCHKAGYDNERIRKVLLDHYKGKKGRTPWDFLKDAYQPIDRELSDTEFSTKMNIQAGIKRNLAGKTGIAYGAAMSPELRPKGDDMPATKLYRPRPIQPLLPIKPAKPAAPPVPKPRRKVPKFP